LTDEKFGAYFTVLGENGSVFFAEAPESFQSAVFSLSDDGWEWQADFGSEYVFTLDETENGYMIYPAQ
ncbi:MAG: hypothetical protein K2N38_13065, partial [Oscillospiraceae bacterium]|nr:hypothetical protein [Oscillospiraceae bacterium]